MRFNNLELDKKNDEFYRQDIKRYADNHNLGQQGANKASWLKNHRRQLGIAFIIVLLALMAVAWSFGQAGHLKDSLAVDEAIIEGLAPRLDIHHTLFHVAEADPFNPGRGTLQRLPVWPWPCNGKGTATTQAATGTTKCLC